MYESPTACLNQAVKAFITDHTAQQFFFVCNDYCAHLHDTHCKLYGVFLPGE